MSTEYRRSSGSVLSSDSLAPLTTASVMDALDLDIFFAMSAGSAPARSRKKASFFLPPLPLRPLAA